MKISVGPSILLALVSTSTIQGVLAEECAADNDGKVSKSTVLPCPAEGDFVVAAFGFTLPKVEQSSATVSVAVSHGDAGATDGIVAQYFTSCDLLPESADEIPGSIRAASVGNAQCAGPLNSTNHLCYGTSVSSSDLGLYETIPGLVVYNTGGCNDVLHFDAIVQDIFGTGVDNVVTDCTDFDATCGTGSGSGVVATGCSVALVVAATVATAFFDF